jgi:Zn-dependent protease with chaperone function
VSVSDRRSFLGRASLAVALLVGFYVLAFGVVAILGFIAITGITEGAVAWVLPAGLAIAGILRGVFFLERGDGKPLGLPVDARSEPKLVALVSEVAAAMQTRPPDEIYLIPDVNAFVYEHGRLLGLIRTRRVMGIGLALIDIARVDELKSVLAHEFGHYVGGDTHLGGIIYRARASLERTVAHLNSGVLRSVFFAYARLFLKLTQRISRGQEFAADAAAVRIGGADSHRSALQRVVGSGAAFDAFMEEFVVPLWEEGRFPDNLYAGFRSFVVDPERSEQVAGYVEVVKDREEEYGSHPSLGRRLESISDVPATTSLAPGAARELLVHPDTSEREMSRLVSQAAAPDRTLSPIPWEEVGEVFAARIRVAADRFVDALGSEGLGIEGDRLPRIVLVLERADANKIVRQLIPLREYPPEAIDGVVRDAIHYFVAATMANDLIERHGHRLRLSWTKPFLLVAPDGSTTDVGERVERALETRDLRSLLIGR